MSEEDLHLRIGGDPDGALRALDAVKDRAREFAQESVRELGKLAAEVFAVREMFEGLKEGILKADEMRDLANSLAVFTGSTKNAAEAMEFFEEAAIKTRNTGEELAKTFRDVLPQAIARGFSQQTLEHVTVWLGQLATVRGKTLDEMESGFQQLLAGRARATNPVLEALGITKSQIKDLGWDELLEKMAGRLEEAEDMGQSFESAMHKTKEAWLEAFGEGFNDATGHARKGSTASTTSSTTRSSSKVFRASVRLSALWRTRSRTPAMTSTRSRSSSARFATRSIRARSRIRSRVPSSRTSSPASVCMRRADARSTTSRTTYRDARRQLRQRRATSGPAATASSLTANHARMTCRNSGRHEARHHIQKLREEMMLLAAETDKSTKAFADQASALGMSKQVYQDYFEYLRQSDSIDADVEKSMVKLGAAFKDLGSSPEVMKALQNLNALYVAGHNLADAQLNAKLTKFTKAQPFWGVDNPLWYTDDNSQRTQQSIAGMGEIDRLTVERFRANVEEVTNIWQRRLQQDRGLFADLLTDAGQTGGRQFGQIAARAFNGLIQSGADDFGKRLLGFINGGSAGDPHKLDALGDQQDPNTYYDANGNVLQPSFRGKVVQGALGAAQIGFGAYQGALTGAPGSRTAGTFGGALSGAGLGAELGGATGMIPGAIIGAVAGLVIGAVGSYLGEKQHQSEYQYGIPGIDANGQATFTNGKNLTPALITQMQQQVQGTYDQYRNSYMRTLFDLGMGGPSSPLGSIDGRFQPNPSGHWGEHYQQFLSGTLPADVAGQFKGDLRSGFGNVGLSGGQFDAIWQKWSNLDPAKMASMFDTLAQVFSGNSKAQSYFSGGGQIGIARTDLHASFADQMQSSDKDLLEFGSHLKDLVGEDQINAAKQLVDMEKSARTRSSRSGPTSCASPKQAHQQIADAKNNLRLNLYRKVDGSTDYEGQAHFLQGHGQRGPRPASGIEDNRRRAEVARPLHERRQLDRRSRLQHQRADGAGLHEVGDRPARHRSADVRPGDRPDRTELPVSE
jgi:hypothetical protein